MHTQTDYYDMLLEEGSAMAENENKDRKDPNEQNSERLGERERRREGGRGKGKVGVQKLKSSFAGEKI